MASKRGSRSVPSTPCSVAGPAGPGVGEEDGEVDLVLVGVEVQEQLLHLVDHLVDAGVGPVHLVDHQHHRQAGLERLAEHEAGLGEGPLGGVDQQQDPVDHGQAPLDLAAEVGVPGGVDDVDLDPVVETAVFLARMVMPFSRSRSPESMTRSLTDSLARKAPDCRSMASTRVVLPWSTWATMATLRMSSRVSVGDGA